MHVNLIGFLAVALSVAAFFFTHLKLRKWSAGARLAAIVVFGVAALPSVLFAIYYLHVLPEWEWFYTLRSWTGSEFLVIFLGAAGGALAALLPRVLTVVPLFCVLVLGLVPYVKPIVGPLPDSAFVESWRGEACLQSTPSTCGAASVCTVLRRFGIQSSERAAARAAFSYSGGTEAWYLARYVHREGLTPHFRFAGTFEPSFELPSVVGVRLGGVGHFIAVLAIEGDDVIYADPLFGKKQTSLAEFRRRYDFTGFHMVVTKN